MTTLAQQHDCLLLDLDGTVFRGHEPTPGAVDTLASVDSRILFVTNNASRDAEQVAEHLRELGFAAAADDVVTSAQSAARLLAGQVPPGGRVLVVGTDALADEISGVGLEPVRRWSDRPVAVVQGHSPDTGWQHLAEAALAIRSGALWVAANVDKTLPSEHGLLPGNGSMVAALRTATDADPQVAGKPAPALMQDALARGEFDRPLVVGDRLDTDIAGANAARLPSLMVLCGVNSAEDAIWAVREQRPTFLAADLRALTADDTEALRIAPHPGWRVEVDNVAVTLTATGSDPGDSLAPVRAIAAAVWASGIARRPIRGHDDTARQAVQRWSLVSDRID
ncbi:MULTISPECIES: HAD-IIA family hydrolase [Mycolicibacterium]|uniref:HAD-superfamily hydrolase, subfamily IIA n=1 Tax=Mycolicibacterium vanbaalenii (strain DSM 7251 / JCM 13017 / BCRC 16820 / KCTC 9966 / NRRL B-24157 / PYR-1) TaxID=350058 RepID=A1TA90_MYCVP|nr:HAD-IIA family hydrolase [Mycolicibacterium vanbaalenii]ABM14090.1 HAD-superfamily hydrolase, subfamily IIA [Mycolicibacterium vanbaalenii PYR-1]MCV7128547.1 HAD-IIA family hydrolase [Mycolicibacterium vanbaalenii PYR-1]UJL27716.1 HAD-IIA family hydrolase [Mycolicibacterium vanbaalenii]WND54401.1 HAD-IIA family hydrolase [Mycolicibacterium vanbaalenii]